MSKLARDVMTPDPACCSPHTSIDQVARMMIQNNCGEIPIVDSANRPVGVVTDRDIVCRIVAEGKNPIGYTAEHAMTSPVVTLDADVSIDEVIAAMETHQIRRVVVVDEGGGRTPARSLARRERRCSLDKQSLPEKENVRSPKLGFTFLNAGDRTFCVCVGAHRELTRLAHRCARSMRGGSSIRQEILLGPAAVKLGFILMSHMTTTSAPQSRCWPARNQDRRADSARTRRLASSRSSRCRCWRTRDSNGHHRGCRHSPQNP